MLGQESHIHLGYCLIMSLIFFTTHQIIELKVLLIKLKEKNCNT